MQAALQRDPLGGASLSSLATSLAQQLRGYLGEDSRGRGQGGAACTWRG